MAGGATTRRVRVVGRGRAGGAFAAALGAVGWEVETAPGRDPGPADGADLVLLCVPDSAVAATARSVVAGPAVVAHVAGSLGLDVLGRHGRVGAVHPLVALPSAELGAARLRDGATFAVAGDPICEELVDALGGRSLDVPDAARARYHAAAVIASNHLVGLLGQVARVGGSIGVPLDAYLDLVRGTVDNVAELGPTAALTGPAARGDVETIERHLAVLPAEERDAYSAMMEMCRRLVEERP